MALNYASLTIPPAAALNAAAQPRPLAAAGARSLIPVTYGEDRVAALILNVLPGPGQMLVVQCLWGHACSQVDELRLNDTALPSGSTVTSYIGNQVTPDPTMVAVMTSLPYTDTLEGYAYSVVQMPLRAFDGALNFSARIRGRALYDPRKDSTAGGSGSHRLANPATWEYSDNPSLILSNWWVDTLFGPGDRVVWSSVGPAANANDAMVGSPAEKHRQLGLTLTIAAGLPAVAETLRAYAGCWLIPTGEGVRLLPDADMTPVASYSHNGGEIAAMESLELSDQGNAPTVVEVSYTDTAQIPWREATAQAVISGAGITLPWRLSAVRLPGIQRYSQAYREAVERLNKLTLGNLSTVVEVFDVGIRHEVGDVITLSHPLGITSKPMRISSPPEMPAAGRWRLPVAEHDPAVYSTEVETQPTYADTALVVRGVDRIAANLIDATWWRPSAAWEWPVYAGPNASNAIVWGAGPKGYQQPIWQATASGAGGANGGWEDSTLDIYPRASFVVDPNSTYRFSVPARRTSGSGTVYWGPSPVDKVCTLNTGTLNADPYGWAADLPLSGRWYLLVFYVFPAGSTGLTHDNAGAIDMETGALVAAGTNFCWAAATTECSTRAKQFGSSSGAVVRFAQPQVELFDGYEEARMSYIGQGAVGYPNLTAAVANDLSDALSGAAAAQATADGKIDSYWQASAPGSASEGDLWFDTDDGNRQYRWTSGAWVAAADTRIGTALSAASDAQATADGKVVTFVQSSAPTAEAVGDLWLDSDDGNKIYRWNGTSWVALAMGTGALLASSATEVAGATSVANISGSSIVNLISAWDTSYAGGLVLPVLAYTYTPPVSCEILATINGYVTIGLAGSSTEVWFRVSIQLDGAWDGTQLVDVRYPAAAGTDHAIPISFSRRFSATAGVSMTFQFFVACKTLSDTTIVKYPAALRLEVIKR
jgi:hypothetical protein